MGLPGLGLEDMFRSPGIFPRVAAKYRLWACCRALAGILCNGEQMSPAQMCGGFMNNRMRSIAIAAAFTFTLSAAPTVLHASPTAAFVQDHDQQKQEEHPEYKNNSFYKVGNREGYQDYQHKTQRADHTHKYKSDDDRKAHDYGYQQGLQGHRTETPR
jgi:hypothetical protein